MNAVKIYEEYRLIERNEANINRAWKGAHLLLFFLTFVFGSFCTFCFHMLMYLFDEKCVLFPKLHSLTSQRHNVIYEFMPSNKDVSDLPVDFVSTQWVEKSTCALPTYVPLVSGIFGLVWTTMFLMCSTGTRTLTGLQRPWRVLPPVFLFSLAMGSLCIYSSVITHYGLQELCVKLGEITGSSTCTYAVNVVTLAYERRIRGVYQATRLTIISAWLHTACWLCSALLAVVRVVLAVDFQLVRVQVTLHADIDRLMERNETQLRTISPDDALRMKDNTTTTELESTSSAELTVLVRKPSDSMYQVSDITLHSEVNDKQTKAETHKNVSNYVQYIGDILFQLINTIDIRASDEDIASQPPAKSHDNAMSRKGPVESKSLDADTVNENEIIASGIVQSLINRLDEELLQIQPFSARQLRSSESFLIQPSEFKKYWERMKVEEVSSKEEHYKPKELKKKKSNLKNASSQTGRAKKKGSQKRVLISEKSSFASAKTSDDDEKPSTSKKSESDKETQTQEKEKQE